MILFWLGIVCVVWWCVDLFNILVLIREPSWLLWYSSAGLILTGIALITENDLLLASLFCALFIPESVWAIDFFFRAITGHQLLGFTNYAFVPTFAKKDFYMSFYHGLIPIVLYMGVKKKHIVTKKAWIGASLYTATLLFLTYLFVNHKENVNCVFHLDYCNFNFPFLEIPNPYRIFVALLIVIPFLYIPTNILLLRLNSYRVKRILDFNEKNL